ncbi:GDSL-type esterase/lipase family protein [Polyangium sp. 15x6]|uniref:GDSL-type esterase/lipase family protein n=1 Tax=Polyangium sp. 15x6 TaxID=3042687 RepID=UPI00249B7FB4|nr:GDSL-type esterase/lipase family protein [Polyangium sp. 15x6]
MRRLRPASLFVLAALACSGCAESASNPKTSPSAERAPVATSASAPASASAAAPVPAPAPPRDSRRAYIVAAMGDSLTDARSHGGKFLDSLRAHCPESRFDNYGIGGQMVNQMHRRFARDVLGEPAPSDKPAYTHVIIFGGVNDLYSDETAFRTPKLIQADLAGMYALAKGRNMQVVALTVAPWGGFSKYWNDKRAAATAQVNDWIRARKAAGEVDHVVDAFALLSCGNPNLICPDYAVPFKDGLHFGPKGHEKLGEVLLRDVFTNCR